MQVTLNPCSAAETRLIASLLTSLADLQEADTVPATDVPALEPVKKTRAKKTEPAPEPAGNESATTVEPVAESGSPETAAPVATHDILRTLYGELVAAGKRDQVVAAIKTFGVKSIKDIPEDKLDEVHAAMKAVS